LKITSFSASWARAWTPDEGILEHHTHLLISLCHIGFRTTHKTPLTPIVASIVLVFSIVTTASSETHAIPTPLRSTTSCFPLAVARWKDSIKTCMNEAIIATEKMSFHVSHSFIPHAAIDLRHQGARIAFYQRDTAHQPCRFASYMPRTYLMFIGLYPNSPAGSQDDNRAQEIKNRVDKGSGEGYGCGVDNSYCFRCYQYDIDDCIDYHQPYSFHQK
jgi:hypothetical protein